MSVAEPRVYGPSPFSLLVGENERRRRTNLASKQKPGVAPRAPKGCLRAAGQSAAVRDRRAGT